MDYFTGCIYGRTNDYMEKWGLLMGNLTIATIFVVTVNILMWFSTMAMVDINPTGTFCYNVDGTIIGEAMTTSGNYTIINNNVTSQLPTSETPVTTSGTTNIFTDIFSSILSWFKTAPGIKYVYGVVAAPMNILTCMGLPSAFGVGIGILWYLVSFLVLIAFLWGRE